MSTSQRRRCPPTVSRVFSALKPSCVGLAIGLILSACSSSESPREPETYVVGVTEPASLLPAQVIDLPGRMIAGALWTPLVTYDAEKQETTPLAAASVTSADGIVWTIRLRPGMRFHDGSAVTAASYADAWRAAIDEHWPGAVVLTDVLRAKEFRAIDDTTIALTLSQVFRQAPLALGSLALAPLPPAVLSSRDWPGFARNPVGNGPYRLSAAWQPGTGARLTRADTYQGDSPGRARAISVRVLDPAAQYREVRSGGIDLATSVPGSSHEAMARDFAGRHLTWPLPSLTYLSFPMSNNPFADPVVRHAIALAIDRAALEAGPLDHQVDVARSLLPPYVALAQRPGPCRPCNSDPAAAKDLLAQSGALTGPVTLRHPGLPWAPALADQLHRTLGLDFTPSTGTGSDGPMIVTRPLFTPTPREPLTNLPGYTAPSFTDLLTSADAAGTPTESAQLYRFAENQVLRDLPVAPLWSAHAHAVWTNRVGGIRVDPYRDIDLANIAPNP